MLFPSVKLIVLVSVLVAVLYAECPMMKCHPCNSGFLYDEKGCRTCECVDRCERFECPPGKVCKEIEIRCIRAPCYNIARCALLFWRKYIVLCNAFYRNVLETNLICLILEITLQQNSQQQKVSVGICPFLSCLILQCALVFYIWYQRIIAVEPVSLCMCFVYLMWDPLSPNSRKTARLSIGTHLPELRDDSFIRFHLKFNEALNRKQSKLA
ncbi:hypothetical protein HELRODRAFT_172855 [Helobdella robusta]|uniref:Antistasin-like domain-containing protein n=1 Tax=Helobdella robusta TaxID=6412 RepID=T1F607_HELRO|nr:hypothetical protein HELRODRAFT_172855 [Helobdella robusta]ESO04468.1 hypothetical protein HELRODRAFT_172855 [Helobdella robusta]